MSCLLVNYNAGLLQHDNEFSKFCIFQPCPWDLGDLVRHFPGPAFSVRPGTLRSHPVWTTFTFNLYV